MKKLFGKADDARPVPAIPRSRRYMKFKNNLSAWIFLIPAVVIVYLMVWRPTVVGCVWSFFKMKGYSPDGFIGFRNYIEVIKDTQFPILVRNTLAYVGWSLIIGYLPPIIFAVMLNEMVHFKSGFKIISYLPAVIPGVAAMLMWYFIYYPGDSGLLNMLLHKLGMNNYTWLNDQKFVILWIIVSKTWMGFAATMLLYYAALQGIPSDMYEVAIIEGAGVFRRFWHVSLPQMSGVMLLTLVSQIISVFQVLEEPLVMTQGGPNNASASLGYQMYRYGFVTGKAGHAMALGTITFILLMILTCFYFYLNRKVENSKY